MKLKYHGLKMFGSIIHAMKKRLMTQITHLLYIWMETATISLLMTDSYLQNIGFIQWIEKNNYLSNTYLFFHDYLLQKRHLIVYIWILWWQWNLRIHFQFLHVINHKNHMIYSQYKQITCQIIHNTLRVWFHEFSSF